MKKLEESQAKEQYQKNVNGLTIMAKLSWRTTKLSPGARFLSIFYPGAIILQKFSARGQGIWLPKKFPGGQPGGGGMLVLGIDWCITARYKRCSTTSETSLMKFFNLLSSYFFFINGNPNMTHKPVLPLPCTPYTLS